MYSEIGSKSNTMIFSDRPGDVNALLAQAAAVFSSSFKTGANASTNTNHEDVSVSPVTTPAATGSGWPSIEYDAVGSATGSESEHTTQKSDGR